MKVQFLMFKDQPVLRIDSDYSCQILDYHHLPYALRYEDVNYDDVMHGWTETRTMSVGRTNAKKILQVCKISQNNSYAIAKICHFVTLSDCYWIKEEDEAVSWADVNLFSNRYEAVLTRTAIFGVSGRFTMREIVHTPELTTIGISAKGWVHREDGIYLYKVGKIELAASEILEQLGVSHVTYLPCGADELSEYASPEQRNKIAKAGEELVKCRCITSEERSIITWEDFAVYCERHGSNPYTAVRERYAKDYDTMQIADYLIGNDDRHTANYGFYVDNASGEITGLYPLMDHDHAFVNGDLGCQTEEKDRSLWEAAREAQDRVRLDLTALYELPKPRTITEEQWNGVLERGRKLEKI